LEGFWKGSMKLETYTFQFHYGMIGRFIGKEYDGNGIIVSIPLWDDWK